MKNPWFTFLSVCDLYFVTSAVIPKGTDLPELSNYYTVPEYQNGDVVKTN